MHAFTWQFGDDEGNEVYLYLIDVLIVRTNIVAGGTVELRMLLAGNLRYFQCFTVMLEVDKVVGEFFQSLFFEEAKDLIFNHLLKLPCNLFDRRILVTHTTTIVNSTTIKSLQPFQIVILSKQAKVITKTRFLPVSMFSCRKTERIVPNVSLQSP